MIKIYNKILMFILLIITTITLAKQPYNIDTTKAIITTIALAKKKQPYTIENVRVVKVYDGDTITVLYNNKKVKVRLYGIDAPELKQSYGKQARDYLSNIVLNKDITLKIYNKDVYGRQVAEVIYNNVNINQLLVKTGNVYVYTKYNNELNVYVPLEQYAKQNKLGVWNPRLNMISPEEYRKANK